MLHRIREAFADNADKFYGAVEADETYIGGKEGNKHASRSACDRRAWLNCHIIPIDYDALDRRSKLSEKHLEGSKMEEARNQSHNGDEAGGNALSVIRAAMALPRAKVDRESFLREQLLAHCSENQVDLAIEFNPAHARIPITTIDDIADSVIKFQNLKVAAGSTLAGMPGGIALAATVPLDLAQNTAHAIVLAQKLAYLYGWPDVFQEGAPDEETLSRMAVLLGTMLGLDMAKNLLSEVSSRFAGQVVTRLPRYALTKTAYYPVIKEICKWLGIKLTKSTFAQGVAKAIPVVSGGISGTATFVVQRKMAHRLKNHLRELEFAKTPQDDDRQIIILDS